jgi:hypothetical protein
MRMRIADSDRMRRLTADRTIMPAGARQEPGDRCGQHREVDQEVVAEQERAERRQIAQTRDRGRGTLGRVPTKPEPSSALTDAEIVSGRSPPDWRAHGQHGESGRCAGERAGDVPSAPLPVVIAVANAVTAPAASCPRPRGSGRPTSTTSRRAGARSGGGGADHRTRSAGRHRHVGRPRRTACPPAAGPHRRDATPDLGEQEEQDIPWNTPVTACGGRP